MNVFKRKPSHEEVSRKGGKAVVEKYGPAYMGELGKKGATSKLEKDPDYFKKLAKLGVEGRLKKKEKTSGNLVEVLTGT